MEGGDREGVGLILLQLHFVLVDRKKTSSCVCEEKLHFMR